MRTVIIGLAAALLATTAQAQTTNGDTSGASAGASAGSGSAGQSDQMLKRRKGGGEMGEDRGAMKQHSDRSGSGADVRVKGEASSGDDTMVRHRRTVRSGGGGDVSVRTRVTRSESSGPDVVVHRRHVVHAYDDPSVTVVHKKRYVRHHHHGPAVSYTYRSGTRHYVQDEPTTVRIHRKHVVRTGGPESVTIRQTRRHDEGVSVRMHGQARGRFEEGTSASVRTRGGEQHQMAGQQRKRMQSEDRTGSVGSGADANGSKSMGGMQGSKSGKPVKKLPGSGGSEQGGAE